MTLFKKYIDDKGFVSLLTWEAEDEYDFSLDPETNLYGEDNIHSFCKENSENDRLRINKLISTGILKIRRCRCCRKYFFINKQTMDLYDEIHKNYPSLCFGCKNRDQTTERLRTDVPIIRERYEYRNMEEY